MTGFPWDSSYAELATREADEARAEDEAEAEARAMLDDERAAAEAMEREAWGVVVRLHDRVSREKTLEAATGLVEAVRAWRKAVGR